MVYLCVDTKISIHFPRTLNYKLILSRKLLYTNYVQCTYTMVKMNLLSNRFQFSHKFREIRGIEITVSIYQASRNVSDAWTFDMDID